MPLSHKKTAGTAPEHGKADSHGYRILSQAAPGVPVIFLVLFTPARVLQVAEELTVRLEQQHVTIAPEGVLVGLQTAGK